MPILTLTYNKKKIYIYDLNKGKSLTIGRDKGNDVVVENLSVSNHHATVSSVGENFVVHDLKSRNGTCVNNKLISTHTLKKGDVILIGKHELEFSYEKWESLPTKTMDQDLTMVMDTEKHKDITAKNVLAKGEGKKTCVLTFLTKGKGDVILTKQLTRIGKSKDSDIVIKGLTIGQTAATITRRPDGYYFSYVDGMAKPKINGKKVTELVKLEKFDTIDIGPYKMQLILANI